MTDPADERAGSEPQRRAALHSVDPQRVAGRRRTVPRSEETSDLTRFKGVWLAAFIAAVATAVGLLLTVDIRREKVPGPLSRPHRDAGLECAACHQAERPVTRCTACHEGHASTRAGHARLRESGRMTCVTCHAVHTDMQGVEFSAEEGVIRYGTFGEQVLSAEAPAGVAGVVPVVSARVCGSCHQLDGKTDPIARCLLGGHRTLGDARPSVCFDEHRSVTASTYGQDGSARERLALWEAARTVVEDAPTPKNAPPPSPPIPWLWMAGGLIVAAGAASLVRAVGRHLRRRRREPATGQVPSARPPARRRLPVIDTSTCIGCSACVDVCPYDVFEITNYVARVVRPDDCCGLTLCEQRCPNGSLVVTDGELIEDRPAVDADLASRDVSGLYLAGDLTGMPLIRNAINQGATAVKSAAASLKRDGQSSAPNSGQYDLIIVGSGPAGLSAALQAKSMGLTYAVLEQGSVAESIRSFPRGKLVFDQPLGVPLVGDLWLAEATKEELLGKWLRIVRSESLAIHEGARVTSVQAGAGPGGSFLVETTGSEGPRSWTGRRVILALGKRGTPRKLSVPIPDAWLDRVHYAMADARSFAGRRVLVVGLGDVAMETAIALARQADARVEIAYRGEDFRRGKARNVAEIRRLVEAGRIVVHWRSDVVGLEPGGVTLEGPRGRELREADAVFVMIGSIVPWAFLASVGVRRVGSAEKAH